MSATILLIRHAATALAGTFCGWSDPPLNELGREQAAALAKRLEDEGIDALYCSDLRRAQETAATVGAPRGLKPQVRPRIREIDFGQWEAQTWSYVALHYPVYSARWMAEFPHLPAPDGETHEDFRRRVLEEMGWLSAELEDVKARRNNGADTQIAVVTHAGVMGLVLEEFGGWSNHAAWQRTREYTCMIRCVLDESDGTLRVSEG